jgi:hypothetical protein
MRDIVNILQRHDLPLHIPKYYTGAWFISICYLSVLEGLTSAMLIAEL